MFTRTGNVCLDGMRPANCILAGRVGREVSTASGAIRSGEPNPEPGGETDRRIRRIYRISGFTKAGYWQHCGNLFAQNGLPTLNRCIPWKSYLDLEPSSI